MEGSARAYEAIFRVFRLLIVIVIILLHVSSLKKMMRIICSCVRESERSHLFMLAHVVCVCVCVCVCARARLCVFVCVYSKSLSGLFKSRLHF